MHQLNMGTRRGRILAPYEHRKIEFLQEQVRVLLELNGDRMRRFNDD